MSFLKSKIGQAKANDNKEKRLLDRFGVDRNPFPPANQTTGHPRLPTELDEEIVPYIRNFDRDKTSQVLVIEGTQGTGKTNLLNFYEKELNEYYEGKGFYVIRYYPDPEPGLEKILQKILQDLGTDFLIKFGVSAAHSSKLEEVLSSARSSDFRKVIRMLSKLGKPGKEVPLQTAANQALEWLLGNRVLKKDRELFGIQLRLDTVESKVVALRDLVEVGVQLGILQGLVLLLDELEKQDVARSKMDLLRFLSALRALMDALPKHFFMMAAMTPQARSRYFAMLPALSGRLQNRLEIKPLIGEDQAMELYTFYMDEAKKRAAGKPTGKIMDIVSYKEAADIFAEAMDEARKQANEGVRHRDFLNRLHKKAEEKIDSLAK